MWICQLILISLAYQLLILCNNKKVVNFMQERRFLIFLMALPLFTI